MSFSRSPGGKSATGHREDAVEESAIDETEREVRQLPGIGANMDVVIALRLRNIKIFARNRVQLIFTIIMPFFFLYVFNAIFKIDNIANPVNYMLAGIVITNVFQQVFIPREEVEAQGIFRIKKAAIPDLESIFLFHHHEIQPGIERCGRGEGSRVSDILFVSNAVNVFGDDVFVEQCETQIE